MKLENANPPNRPTDPRDRQRRRAVVRLVFGQCQVVGATITLVLMLQTGVSPTVIWMASATAVITLASLLLFRIVWRD